MFVSTCCFCDVDAFQDLDSDFGSVKGRVTFGHMKLTLEAFGSTMPVCVSEAQQYTTERQLITFAEQFIQRYDIYLVDADQGVNESTFLATQPVVALGGEWDGCCRSAMYEVEVDVQIPVGSQLSFLVIPVTTSGGMLPGQVVKGADCCDITVQGEAVFEIAGDAAEAQDDLAKFNVAIGSSIASAAGVGAEYVEVESSIVSRRLRELQEQADSTFRLLAEYTIIIPIAEEGVSANSIAAGVSQASFGDLAEMVQVKLAAAGLSYTVVEVERVDARVMGDSPPPLAEEESSTSAANAAIIVVALLVVLSIGVVFVLYVKPEWRARLLPSGEGSSGQAPEQPVGEQDGGEGFEVMGEEEEIQV